MGVCIGNYHWMLIFLGFQSVFTVQLNVMKGSDVLLMITSKTSDEAHSCEIAVPDGSSYFVFPNSTLPFYIQDMTNAFQASCTVKLLSVSVGRKGVYVLTINTTAREEKSDTFLIVQESAKLWPSSLEKVYQGEDFFMKLDIIVPGLTECHVVYPIGSSTKDIIVSKENNPFQEGQCGLRASNVSISNSGFWTLYTINSTQNSYVGQKKITVFGDTGEFVQQSLRLGSKSSIAIYSSNLETDIAYCMSKSTDGTLSDLQNGACSLSASTITDNDARNYSFKLGLKGKLEEVDSTLQVSIQPADVSPEYKPIETSANTTASGNINMLCRLWSTNKITDDEDNKVSFCRFIHPDGTGLQVNEGIGNKAYSYFGDGLNTYYYKDCGLTIHLPTEADHGTWKCYMYWKSKLRMGEIEVSVKTGDFSSTENTNVQQEVAVSGSKNVVLNLGAVNQALYCQTDRKLDYCWFLMPNGTHAIPTHDPQDLMRGLCSYDLGSISFNHSGDWVCNMGVMGRQEGDLTYHISVRVTDSTLMAEPKEVKAVAGGTATLHCTSVPAGKTLSYCRFVSPIGKGLSFSEVNSRNERIMNRYQRSDSPQERYNGIKVGICSMTITSVHPEDYGKWRCSGVIQGTYTEGFDFVTVSQAEAMTISSGAISGITVGAVIVVVLVAAVVWYVVRKRRYIRHQNESNHSSEHSSEDGFQMRVVSPPNQSAAVAYLRASFRRQQSDPSYEFTPPPNQR